MRLRHRAWLCPLCGGAGLMADLAWHIKTRGRAEIGTKKWWIFLFSLSWGWHCFYPFIYYNGFIIGPNSSSVLVVPILISCLALTNSRSLNGTVYYILNLPLQTSKHRKLNYLLPIKKLNEIWIQVCVVPVTPSLCATLNCHYFI